MALQAIAMAIMAKQSRANRATDVTSEERGGEGSWACLVSLWTGMQSINTNISANAV